MEYRTEIETASKVLLFVLI